MQELYVKTFLKEDPVLSPNMRNVTTPDKKISFVNYSYTKHALTERSDLTYLFNHGGSVYTVVSFVVDTVNQTIPLSNQKILDMIIHDLENLKPQKRINVVKNPITNQDEITNVRIKTMATMPVKGLAGLQEGLHELNGQTIRIIDARQHPDYGKLIIPPQSEQTLLEDDENAYIKRLFEFYNPNTSSPIEEQHERIIKNFNQLEKAVYLLYFKEVFE